MLNPEHRVLEDKDGLVPLQKWQKTVDVMARIFNAPAGFIVQYCPDAYQVVISSDQESNPYEAGCLIPPETNIFCKKVVEEQEALYVQDAPLDPAWDTNPEVVEDGFRSYLGLPVCWPDGEPFGTICVMDFERTDYQNDYVDLIAELRDLIQADLEILTQYQELSSLAMTDELTGLYNRRGFLSVARRYVALVNRSGLTLGMLYLDMDGLKKINDQQGHAQGDFALKALAQAMQESLRENDIPARLSGDEFVMLAVVSSQSELNEIAQRVEQAMSDRDLSVSIGQVLIADPRRSLEYWLDQADDRMYQHKRAKAAHS